MLGGPVSIEEPELAGTRPPRWQRGQVGKRHLLSEVRYQRLLASENGTINTSARTHNQYRNSPQPRIVSSPEFWLSENGLGHSDHCLDPVLDGELGVLCVDQSPRT